MRRVATVAVVITAVVGLGCTTQLRNRELTTVAKDWCNVIRASQVIPVYPLTEDLQPGDVLLVSTPIDEQSRIYKKRGFLPLDQLYVRLLSRDFRNWEDVFKGFYNDRYGTDIGARPPGNWGDAPHASFPTYRFTVRSGGGVNLAIPIQGVPLALGLMNSGRASGSVTIATASTYGLDNFVLQRLAREWAFQNRGLLRSYEPQREGQHFLRVVTRGMWPACCGKVLSANSVFPVYRQSLVRVNFVV